MGKSKVLALSFVGVALLGVLTALYIEGEMLDRKLDGRTRQLAPGVSLSTQVLSRSFLSRQVQANLKVDGELVAQWEGEASLGWHINLDLTSTPKSPLTQWAQTHGLEHFSDRFEVIVTPVTQNVAVQYRTPELHIAREDAQGTLGATRLYVSREGDLFKGALSVEKSDLTVNGVNIQFRQASNEFVVLLPTLLTNSRLNWTIYDLTVGKKRPVHIKTAIVKQWSIPGDTVGHDKLFNQSFSWDLEGIEGKDRGDMDRFAGTLIIENAPLENLPMLMGLVEAIQKPALDPRWMKLFEHAGTSLVLEKATIRTGDHESVAQGVLRYAPVMGAAPEWGSFTIDIDRDSVNGFGYAKTQLDQWTAKHYWHTTDLGWATQGYVSPKGIRLDGKWVKPKVQGW